MISMTANDPKRTWPVLKMRVFPHSRSRSPSYLGALLITGFDGIRLGISLSLSAGTQSGSPALRAPLTNNSPSLSAVSPVSMRYLSALQLGSSFVTWRQLSLHQPCDPNMHEPWPGRRNRGQGAPPSNLYFTDLSCCSPKKYTVLSP